MPKRDELQAQILVLVDRAERKPLTFDEARLLRRLTIQATDARRSLVGEVRRLQARLRLAEAADHPATG